MIGRAVLSAIDDRAKTQIVQASMFADETRDKMERMAEYGFTSVPLPGSQAVAVFVGGERGHGIVIATGDTRYRLKGLAGGEVALYTDEGDKIILKRGKMIEVTTDTLLVKAATKVRFETPLVENTGAEHTTGNITSDADITAAANMAAVNMTASANVKDGSGKSMAADRAVYNGHSHTDPQGGNTGGPSALM